MNTIIRLRSVTMVLGLLMAWSGVYGQEKSARFAHVTFPSELEAMSGNLLNAFVHDGKSVWRVNTKDWTVEEVAKVTNGNWFTQIQGIASDDKYVYYYVNGQGIYRVPVNGNTSTLVRPKSDEFTRNYEEVYSAMNIDPSGKYLLLYGWKENAAVFAIDEDMAPKAVFNDYVRDAYWLDNMLWAGTLDKVVINNRKGRSMNNQDFINYGDNDQHDMKKIYLQKNNILPNMGETEMSIGDYGEMVRLIYNKGNGDLLLCTASLPANTSTIYKITTNGAEQVAQLNCGCGDFAAYGNTIIAKDGYKFIETSYGVTKDQELKSEEIVTDLLPAPMWKGHKPEPYRIGGARFMDFDRDGNLWILTGRDLFVRFK